MRKWNNIYGCNTVGGGKFKFNNFEITAVDRVKDIKLVFLYVLSEKKTGYCHIGGNGNVVYYKK